MITTTQKADLLFKKYLGKGGTGDSFYYFNEPKDGRPTVYPTQIWSDYYQIPKPASPVPYVVEQLIDVQLVPIPGHTNSFSSSWLVDAIPFNFDPEGSYLPQLKKSTGEVIPFTDPSDWFVDGEAGIVTFYSGLPTGVSDTNPPSMSFWRYIGQKGGGGSGGGGSYVLTASVSQDQLTASYAMTASRADTASYISGARFKDYMSGQIEYPVVDDMYYLVSNNPAPIVIESMTYSMYSGIGTASLLIDANPIPELSNLPLVSYQTTSLATYNNYLESGSNLVLKLENITVGAGRLYFTIGMTRTLL